MKQSKLKWEGYQIFPQTNLIQEVDIMLDRIHDEILRDFDMFDILEEPVSINTRRVFDELQKVIDKTLGEFHQEHQHFKYPPMNLYKRKVRNDKDEEYWEYVIEFLIPNINPDDFKVEVQDDTLILEINKESDEKTEEDKDYIVEWKEFTVKNKIKQVRKVVIPNLRTENVKQEYKNGILRITQESGKRKVIKSIPIEVK